MMTLSVVNHAGRKFTAVFQPKATIRGPLGKSVDFFDATYAGDPRFDEHGQFVACYYAKTLLYNYRTSIASTGGLDMVTYEPEWKLDAESMGVVRAWLHLCVERIR